jgi:hypothetical protein
VALAQVAPLDPAEASESDSDSDSKAEMPHDTSDTDTKGRARREALPGRFLLSFKRRAVFASNSSIGGLSGFAPPLV